MQGQITFSSQLRSSAHFGFVIAMMLVAPPVLAQDICFPTPVSLPGLSGPPDWEAPGTVRTELNEPRWAAAPQTSFASDPTAAEGLWRMVVDAGHTELSVSFQAPTDPNTVSNADAIYFAFTTDGAAATLAKGVRISMPTSGTDPIDIDPAGVLVQGYQYDAGGVPSQWTTPVGAPPWLREPAAWRSDATAAWGINFKIDIAAAGLSVTNAFKITLAMHKRDEGDVTPPFDGVGIFTPDPGLNLLLAGTLFIQNPTLWANAVAINAACASGITISGSQIGTRNANPSRINTTDGAINNFFATPTYPDLPFAGMIEGKFHIANWGSIADPDADWDVIPNGAAVQNGIMPPAPDLQTIEFACPANAGGLTCGLPTPAETHQCVYVELRAAPGQTVQFTRAAAYRNMDFQALSDFEAPAEISVKGLKALFNNDNPRDVYLYVHAKNMKPHQNEPLWLESDKMSATRRFAEVPPASKPRLRQGERAARAEPGKPRPIPTPNTGIRDLDLNAHQALSTVWPTYDVHVFYDTGKIIKIDKVDTKQLAPMYPFTYFYSHEGPLYGFSHALKGIDGAKVEELRPNVFLVSIPSEGSVKIATRATAHEKPKSRPKDPEPPACPACPPPPKDGICSCSLPGATHNGYGAWALLGLVLIGLGLRRRR